MSVLVREYWLLDKKFNYNINLKRKTWGQFDSRLQLVIVYVVVNCSAQSKPGAML